MNGNTGAIGHWGSAQTSCQRHHDYVY